MTRWTDTRRLTVAGLLAVGLSAATSAAVAQSKSPPAPFSGPISVTADQAEWRREGVMRYQGKVRLESAGLILQGENMELTQIRPGRYRARITGSPAQLNHTATSADDQPVDARAGTIVYDSGTGELEMDGKVRLLRGNDELNSDRIVYDLLARRIQAAGGSGGQVRITIQPPAEKPADTGAQEPRP